MVSIIDLNLIIFSRFWSFPLISAAQLVEYLPSRQVAQLVEYLPSRQALHRVFDITPVGLDIPLWIESLLL